MSHSPKTYEDWLALSDEERDTVKFHEWNPYHRDGIAIAFMAATRLALQSKWKVLDIQIGTYHMGEYVLHLIVSEEDYKKCPPMLAESFEGFRVIWSPYSVFQSPPDVQGTLEGKWISEQGDYEYKLRWTRAGVEVQGKVRSTGEILHILDPAVNDRYVLFSTYEDSRNASAQHVFALVGPNQCADNATITEYYSRFESND